MMSYLIKDTEEGDKMSHSTLADVKVKTTPFRKNGSSRRDMSKGDTNTTKDTTHPEDTEPVNDVIVMEGDGGSQVIEVKPVARGRGSDKPPLPPASVHKKTSQVAEQVDKGNLNRPKRNQYPVNHTDLNQAGGGNNHAFSKSVGYSSKTVQLRYPRRKGKQTTTTGFAVHGEGMELAPVPFSEKGNSKHISENIILQHKTTFCVYVQTTQYR